MTTRKIWQSAILTGVLLAACDDPPAQEGLTGLSPLDAGSAPDGAAPAATLPDGGVAEDTRPRTGPAYALVSGDWTAIAISILDAKGQVIADDYVNSGSAKAGLVTALSGDVDLPRSATEPGTLVILDRFKTDVITRIRLADGVVLGQVKTHTPADATSTTAYSSNPHDYVYIDPQTAWVTRNQPNIAPGAPEVDRGNDLFRINPTTMERTGERIDLWGLNETVTRTDPNTGATQPVTLYARPSRMLRLGSTLVVGISRNAYDFKAIGEGVIALVDLTTRAVTPFALPGFKGCTDVSAVQGDADSVLVGCWGDPTSADPFATAGLVMVEVTGATARIEHAYRAADDRAGPATFARPVSLGGTLVGATTDDASGKTPDVFAILDLATGQKTTLASASPGTARFGTAAYDAESHILLVPDASTDADTKPTAGLRRFQRNADGTFTELELVRAAVDTAMPVRHVYPL